MPAFLIALAKKLLSGVVAGLVKDVALALVGRINWKVMIERFASRVLIKSLNKLVALDTNGLTGQTAADALAMLKRDDLPELK